MRTNDELKDAAIAMMVDRSIAHRDIVDFLAPSVGDPKPDEADVAEVEWLISSATVSVTWEDD